GAGVGQDARGIDRTGHRIAELDFRVAYGVAPQQRHPRFAQFVEAAAENLFDDVGLEAVLRERRDGERRQWTAAHRVDVADGVRRSNLAVGVWIVHDRREEIDGLHQ